MKKYVFFVAICLNSVISFTGCTLVLMDDSGKSMANAIEIINERSTHEEINNKGAYVNMSRFISPFDKPFPQWYLDGMETLYYPNMTIMRAVPINLDDKGTEGVVAGYFITDPKGKLLYTGYKIFYEYDGIFLYKNINNINYADSLGKPLSMSYIVNTNRLIMTRPPGDALQTFTYFDVINGRLEASISLNRTSFWIPYEAQFYYFFGTPKENRTNATYITEVEFNELAEKHGLIINGLWDISWLGLIHHNLPYYFDLTSTHE